MKNPESVTKLRGDHSINLKISHEVRMRLMQLSARYDQPMATTIRQVLRVGLPVMEGIADAQREILREYVIAAKKLREARGDGDFAPRP